MSAYKWRYPAGAANPIDGVVLTTSNCAWFTTQGGSDLNAGTDVRPYKSLTKAVLSGKTYIVFSGYIFNEQMTSTQKLIADGFSFAKSNVIPKINFNTSGIAVNVFGLVLDGYFAGPTLSATPTSPNPSISTYNKFKGAASIGFNSNIVNKYFTTLVCDDSGNLFNVLGQGAIKNISVILKQGITVVGTIGGDGGTGKIVNAILAGQGNYTIGSIYTAKNYYNWYIENTVPIKMNGGSGTNETTFTVATSIANLRARAAAVYGGVAADYFPNCYVGDNPFNGTGDERYEVLGDHSLNMTAGAGLVASTMADDNNYVGGFNSAVRWRPGTTDFYGVSNLDLVSNRYLINNPASIATAYGKPKSFGFVRQMRRSMFIGAEGVLNGVAVDSTTDVGAILVPTAGTYSGLNFPGRYVVLVSGAGLIYNGNTYNTGDKFETVSGVTTATEPDPFGQIQEIIEAPNKKNVRWRFSIGGAISSNITTFADNDWLYVVGGTVTQGANTYNAGDSFLYDNALIYTGAYTVQFIFNDSEPFLDMEVSIGKPVSTDDLGVSNGSQSFNYATETSILAKFAQPEIVVQIGNQRYL